MTKEAWLSGKLDEFSSAMMPAAHALVQAKVDLQKFAADLSVEDLTARPNNAPSIAFHLRHIAGSIDRLLTYSRGEELNDAQFDFLKQETAEDSDLSAGQLTQNAIGEINNALEALKNVNSDDLFAERFVGRQKLPTNVFGLLFHIAEHTARHVGQTVTTIAVVKKKKTAEFTALVTTPNRNPLTDAARQQCRQFFPHEGNAPLAAEIEHQSVTKF